MDETLRSFLNKIFHDDNNKAKAAVTKHVLKSKQNRTKTKARQFLAYAELKLWMVTPDLKLQVQGD